MKSSSSLSTDSSLQIHILSLFPDVLKPFLKSSLLGKAQERSLVEFHLVQIRDFATDKHRCVDDKPFGGGEGMLLRADVLENALLSITEDPKYKENPGKKGVFLLSPQGKRFDQAMAKSLKDYAHLILICGHYEGVDERFIETYVDEEISLGDFVLTGGEIPAALVVDAVTRLLPGVVGNEASIHNDSFEKGLLKYPQYTRPREFHGMGVPEVLLSGDHQAISEWRKAESLKRTLLKRPDLGRSRH